MPVSRSAVMPAAMPMRIEAVVCTMPRIVSARLVFSGEVAEPTRALVESGTRAAEQAQRDPREGEYDDDARAGGEQPGRESLDQGGEGVADMSGEILRV